ncbi:MAG: hypothetical protein E5V92_01660 [Mesorhizobium sp.]|nr:MAG: hypothetical protein E5W17_00225 [Mesorhizobium sp.]TJW90543.1 MAG: hypothetical protein E5V92_01660 [Mesorhizobium sp.]
MVLEVLRERGARFSFWQTEGFRQVLGRPVGLVKALEEVRRLFYFLPLSNRTKRKRCTKAPFPKSPDACMAVSR